MHCLRKTRIMTIQEYATKLVAELQADEPANPKGLGDNTLILMIGALATMDVDKLEGAAMAARKWLEFELKDLGDDEVTERIKAEL